MYPRSCCTAKIIVTSVRLISSCGYVLYRALRPPVIEVILSPLRIVQGDLHTLVSQAIRQAKQDDQDVAKDASEQLICKYTAFACLLVGIDPIKLCSVFVFFRLFFLVSYLSKA